MVLSSLEGGTNLLNEALAHSLANKVKIENNLRGYEVGMNLD